MLWLKILSNHFASPIQDNDHSNRPNNKFQQPAIIYTAVITIEWTSKNVTILWKVSTCWKAPKKMVNSATKPLNQASNDANRQLHNKPREMHHFHQSPISLIIAYVFCHKSCLLKQEESCHQTVWDHLYIAPSIAVLFAIKLQ